MTDGDAESRRILTRGISLNYLSLFVGFCSTMILTPTILGRLGRSGYGIWAILSSVVTYLTLLDVGLNTAIAKYTAEYLAKKELKRLNQAISTVLVVMILVACGSVIAIVTVSHGFLRVFNVPADLALEAIRGLVVTAVNGGLLLIVGVLGNIIFGYQRVDLWRGTLIVQTLTTTGLTLVLLYLGTGLFGILAASTGGTIVTGVLFLFILRRNPHGIKLSVRLWNLKSFQEIGPYSVRTFILGLTSRLLYYSHYFVIGMFLGPAQVTPYEIAYKLFFMSTYLFSAISSAMFPTCARLYALGEGDQLRTAYWRTARAVSLIGILLSLSLAFVGGRFLSLWVGPENLAAPSVLITLAVMNVFHAIGTPAAMLLQSVGRNTELVYGEVLNAVLNLTLSVVLVQKVGVVGVALGMVVAYVMSSFVVVLWVPCRVLSAGIKDYWQEVGRGAAVTGMIVATLGYLCFRPMLERMSDAMAVIVGGLTILLLSAAMYVVFGMSREERRRAVGAVGGIVKQARRYAISRQ